jgi:hypothetical protein
MATNRLSKTRCGEFWMKSTKIESIIQLLQIVNLFPTTNYLDDVSKISSYSWIACSNYFFLTLAEH